MNTYFCPTLHKQKYFSQKSVWHDLKNTEIISSQNVSLPLYDSMNVDDVVEICEIFNAVSSLCVK